MPGTRSHIDVAPSASGALASEPGRELFQQRLGIFGLWNAILASGFIPLRIVGELLLDPGRSLGATFAQVSMVAHMGATAAAAVAWLITRRRVWSSRALRTLDMAVTFAIGAFFAVMGATLTRSGSTLIDEPRVAMLTATLAVALTMMWRAITLPSSPQRTAALTSLGVAPLVVADVVVLSGPGPAGLVAPMFTAGWAILSLVACIVTSDVVYGLRREAQRARRLGQYTLDEKIGEGAMGVVYRASHAMLRRPTAIKLLPPTRTGVIDLQRFEREVQLTAMLTHPNTVAIYDYGRTPDGVFYYAMEFLDGINLEELVRHHGALPSGRVVHILRQVCRALAEAHGLGIIHRDIKPANIILTVRGGEPDVAKVVDFGLVKCLDPVRVDITMTMEGGAVLAGTPMYFAPEAIASPDGVEARSDLYSLGAVGYYLVTGQQLFDAGTIIELCAHHLHTTPVAPSVRLGRAIDPGLEAVLMQCLAKTPAERHASALALEESLGSTAAARNWTADDARQWWVEHGETVRGAVASPGDAEAMTVAIDFAAR
jgi:eukaryotic-like serine/threonine-protein kinase